jgi:hypothetical protein
MKKTNQEIIDVIVNASENSYIDKGKEGTTRFCLYISEDDTETVANGLHGSGLTERHLTQLSKEGIITKISLDDYCLSIRIKDSSLTDEQRKEALAGQAEDLEREQAYELEQKEKKHADKCVAMLPKLTEALKEITQFGKSKDKKFSYVTSLERLDEYKQLIAEAEQK